jgi:predicted site-specific integrase-resolvase
MSRDTTEGAGDDLVAVTRAAHLLQVPRSQVARWVKLGQLAVVPTPRHGQLVSLAAARRLAEETTLSAPPSDDDQVRVAQASRLTGWSKVSLYRWIRSGQLASRQTRHGAYVSLADVRALAAQAASSPAERKDEEGG